MQPLFINSKAHFIQPGAISFIPGWILLLILVLTIALLFPKLFQPKQEEKKNYDVFNPYLLAFIIGSLMPIFDDLLTYVFGPPFTHHSLFHSLLGLALTYIIFRSISTPAVSKYAFLGNLTHIIFNVYLDYVAIFFPFTYQEFGLTDLIRVSTYNIKVIHYPLILALFFFASLKFFYRFKKEKLIR